MNADDRLAVIDVVHRWSHVADGDDPSELTAVVTDDAVFEIGDVERHGGRAAIEARFAAEVASRQVQPRRHVRNTIFVETSADRALTRSYYLLTGVGDGLAKALAAGVYEDEVVRTPEGWRIRRRRATPDGGPVEPGALRA